jgi:hypothetical protein
VNRIGFSGLAVALRGGCRIKSFQKTSTTQVVVDSDAVGSAVAELGRWWMLSAFRTPPLERLLCGRRGLSRRGESHPPALAEPGVNLSTHRAPIVQPSGHTPKRQWANRPGSRLKTRARNLRALAGWRRNRLYFRMAQRTR